MSQMGPVKENVVEEDLKSMIERHLAGRIIENGSFPILLGDYI
jgi:hypothetical protein